MLSNATLLCGNNSSLGSVIGTLFPRRPKHRIVLSMAILCLMSLVICLTLITYAQSTRVLLVSRTTTVQQSTATPVASTVTTPASPLQSAMNVAKALVRIDQSVPGSYASEQDYSTWWPSACSAASMTEIINASFHTHYTISTILAIEAAFQNPTVITADSGLLYPNGIDRTMGYFGFVTTHQHYTLDQLITTANAGTPVLVNFPPVTWSGGHFLVVVGGDTQYVHLADSSKLNMRSMTRARFEFYWQGFADTFTPTPYSVMGKPTVTAAFIDHVLAYYHSPAQGQGQYLYDLALKYSIDPAFALSFFGHESTFGTQGEANKSLSLGNLRCISTGYEDLQPSCQDKYAWFPTWKSGFEAFYRLMAGSLYAASGLVVPDQIIPRYAPNSDNNNEAGYISALKKTIERARAGDVDIENFH